MNIRTKLVSLVCVMTIVPAILVGYLAYSLSKSALEAKVKEEFDARRELIKVKINHRLSDLAKNADVWTSAPVMADIKTNDIDMHLVSYLFNTKKSYNIIKNITVINADKKIIASTNFELEDIIKENPQALNYLPLDEALAGKSQSKLGMDAKNNFLVLPIRDVVTKDGSVTGVFICDLETKPIEEIIITANEGKTDENKINVYLTAANSKIAELNEKNIHLELADILKDYGKIPEGFTQFRINNVDYVANEATIDSPLPGILNNPQLLILQPTQLAYQAINELAKYVSMLATTLVFLFVLLGFFFARSLSKPIINLKKIAQDIIKSQDLSKRVNYVSSDEIGDLSISFDQLLGMVQESHHKLEEYSKGLETMISERTQAIRNILDHVTFGLMICDSNLLVKSGYSKSCTKILDLDGVSLENQSLPKLLKLDNRKTDHFSALYSQIFDPDLLLGDLSIDQLPKRFKIDDITIGLTGSIVHDVNGKADGVLFCIADITNLVAAEAEIERNRSLIKILTNRDSFRQFALDVKSRFDTIYGCFKKDDATTIRRELHTLKGNMGVFGISTVAHSIHILEDEKIIPLKLVEKVEGEFREFIEKNKDLLGISYGTKYEASFVVPESLVAKVESKIQEKNIDHIELQNLFVDFFKLIRLKRAKTLLGPIEDTFEQLCSRLGKQAKLIVVGNETLVPTEINGLLKNIPHVLRNALDHGIEPIERRGAKPPEGTVLLKIFDSENEFTIVIEDDGKGINKNELLKKAIGKQLVSKEKAEKMSESEIFNLLFEDGVSTAVVITDISGRGVGMSAVKAAVDALSGKITITSQEGIGTKFTIIIPKLKKAKQNLFAIAN